VAENCLSAAFKQRGGKSGFRAAKGGRGCASAGTKGKGKATQPGKHRLLHRAGSAALNSIALSRLPDTHRSHSSSPGTRGYGQRSRFYWSGGIAPLQLPGSVGNTGSRPPPWSSPAAPCLPPLPASASRASWHAWASTLAVIKILGLILDFAAPSLQERGGSLSTHLTWVLLGLMGKKIRMKKRRKRRGRCF